jgi:hypothetical protein
VRENCVWAFYGAKINDKETIMALVKIFQDFCPDICQESFFWGERY